MKQDSISELTKKAIEAPMALTQLLMEKTQRVKTPSPRLDKIGRYIGACVGAVLLLAGSAGLLLGKSLWAIGAFCIGAATMLSHVLWFGKTKRQKWLQNKGIAP